MKKIENMIQEGLPSKIYLVAFPIPKSRYQIAKEIYHREKYPPTSKVSAHAKQMLEKGYIRETENKKIITDITPLIIEIEKEFASKGIEKLTAIERTQLIAFLDNDLRKLIKEDKQNLVKKAFSNQVKAYEALTFFIGEVAYSKFNSNQFLQNPEIKEMFEKTIPKDDLEFLERLTTIQLSESLIEKLMIYVPQELKNRLEFLKLAVDSAEPFFRYYLENDDNLKRLFESLLENQDDSKLS